MTLTLTLKNNRCFSTVIAYKQVSVPKTKVLAQMTRPVSCLQALATVPQTERSPRHAKTRQMSKSDEKSDNRHLCFFSVFCKLVFTLLQVGAQ